MKHLYTLLCCTLMAASAVAVTPSKLHKNELPAQHLKSTTKIAGVFGASAKSQKAHIKANGLKAKVQEAKGAKAESQWVSLGECLYIEDVATSFFYVDPVKYNVEVYEDQANPGIYRIVNPWQNYPYLEDATEDGGIFDLTEDSYITIDATDPDHVVIPTSPLGMADSDGDAYLCSGDAIYESLGITLDEALESAGTLADNVISFTIEESLYLIQGSYIYTCNGDGKFALVLPGGEAPLEYTIEVETEEAFCPDSDGNYHVTISGDSRIPGLYYAVYSTYDDLYYAESSDLITSGKAVNINETFAVNVSACDADKVYVLILPVDELDQAQEDNAVYLTLYNPGNKSSDWEVLGQADFTDGIISGLFDGFNADTFEVTVEQSKTTSGLLRIVNPYANYAAVEDYLINDHGHNHYIYIDASDPDLVYIKDSPIGLNISGLGEMVIDSEANYCIENYGDWIIDYLPWFGIDGGTLSDNVITFPYSAYLMVEFSDYNYGSWYYTNLKENPDFDEDEYYSNDDYDVDPYLDGDFKLDLTKAYNGIHGIAVDPTVGNAVYYNLQGIRVDNPSNGIYIRKSDKSTMKVYVK